MSVNFIESILQLKRHFSFLREVLIYTLTAFGGPQVHLGMMNQIFVQKRKDLNEHELLDYFSFCQLLPGASSTQLLGLIAYKRGGFLLSLITLIIWILPAGILMGFFSFFISNDTNKADIEKLFRFFPAMTVGFLVYTGWSMMKTKIKDIRVMGFILFSAILSLLFFNHPWIFPILIVFGGFLNNFFLRTIDPINKTKHKRPNTIFLGLFILLFISLGILSETARKQNWNSRITFNLAENFYRFGSIVFGGGDVLLPMMLDQYVERPTNTHVQENNPNAIRLEKDEILIGYGLVKAIPGPVFSIGSYIGGIGLKKQGNQSQMLGCIVGTISLFLPGILLLFFFYPVWEYGKRYTVMQKAAEGVGWVAIGFIWAGSAYILMNSGIINSKIIFYKEIIILISIPLLLNFTRITSPIIVISTLLLGALL
jgi:chromate transporter